MDESGTCEPYDPSDPGSTTVFVVAGITVPSARQKGLTMAFLQLKKEFEPQLRSPGKQLSDLIRFEVKGSKLRRDIARTDRGRNTRRRALGFLDKSLRLLEEHNCRIIGKVVVKVDDRVLADKKEYPRAVQELAVSFNSQAATARTEGIMILDSRTKVKNEGNVHAITTRRFRAGGDYYPRLTEAPVFGHSDTHVPLQIVDLVASGIVFPLACLAFTPDEPSNFHRHSNYRSIKDQFGDRLAKLEHRYVNEAGAMRGGFQVVDPVQKRSSRLLFRD
ncbi:DUF3800 domain-containing protein [Leifsonia aquatica]|uniref:DUF3800 domain-containing protein n=1 Tax=Leifsonia aquatica TaxID=144185 RepID=UPI00380E09DF